MRLGAVCAALGLLACTSTPPPEVRVGGADDAGLLWVPWVDCPSVPILRGHQGGQHVFVSVRVRDGKDDKTRKYLTGVSLTIEASNALVEPGVTWWKLRYWPLDADFAPTSEAAAGAALGPDTWWQVVGVPAFVHHPCDARDRRVRVEARLIDATGGTYAGDACVVPTWTDPCDSAGQGEWTAGGIVPAP